MLYQLQPVATNYIAKLWISLSLYNTLNLRDDKGTIGDGMAINYEYCMDENYGKF